MFSYIVTCIALHFSKTNDNPSKPLRDTRSDKSSGAAASTDSDTRQGNTHNHQQHQDGHNYQQHQTRHNYQQHQAGYTGHSYQQHQAERSDLTNRSVQASLQLRTGNANIADLSDANRPTKIAEKYGELYDNLWTDVFEDMGGSERERIDRLLKIIMRAYEFCAKKASDQMKELTKRCENIMITANNPNVDAQLDQTAASLLQTGRAHLIQYRKDMAAASLMYIAESFLKRCKTEMGRSNSLSPKMEIFIRQCAELCWWMCIHNPQLVLEAVEQHEHLNQELFRPYTRSGDSVDFCVWPALYLHANGPLLYKGVAQARDNYVTGQ